MKLFQFATEFSRFSLKYDNSTTRPFQSFLFLIRDWEYDHQFELGFRGGKKYLAENVFKIKKSHSSGMKELRKFIKSSYESIECFLMPHPGETVAKTKGYDGSWSLIDERFVEQLKNLVPSILAPESLAVKKIAGKEVTGESLYWNMQFYLQLFVKESLPSPQTIFESTVTRFLQDMVSRYATEYRELISNGFAAVITHTDFNILHLDSKKKVIDSYDAERKIGKKSSKAYYRNQLIDKIEEVLNERNQTMYYKIETRIRDREIEMQNNETQRHETEIKDLKRKREEDKKKIGDAQKQLQENVEKLDIYDNKIKVLTDEMNQQQAQIKKEREEQIAREKALAAKYAEDVGNLNKTLSDQQAKLAAKYAEDVGNLNKTLSDVQAELDRKKKEEEERLEKLKKIPRKAYLRQGDCYLCGYASKYASGARKTDCCRSGWSEGEWTIIESGLNYSSWDNFLGRNIEKSSYFIYNEHFNEYLYDAINSPDYTLALWKDDGELKNWAVWKIERKTSQDFEIKAFHGNYIYRYYTYSEPGRWEIINLG